ncbi:MAG TPA: CRTAC1 family protein [Myxococcota bacterium]|nr:CRTAC1 family protein [Myxococcota bacterium]
MRLTIVTTFALALLACASSSPNGPDADVSSDVSSETGEISPDSDTKDSTADDNQLESTEPDDEIPSETAEDDLPPRICHSGTTWTDGTKAFENVTVGTNPRSNLRTLGVTGIRVSSVDFDNDGLPDLIVRGHTVARDSWDEGPRYTWLLKNLGNFQFEDVTKSSNFLAVRDGEGGRVAHAVVFGDVNNDGFLDAYTGVSLSGSLDGPDTGDRPEIMLGGQDGSFSLIDEQPLPKPSEDWRPPVMGASFVDFDGDGFLDLWIGYGAGVGGPEQDRLYKGDGTGKFVDVTLESGLETQPAFFISARVNGKAHRNDYGSTACDLNNDGIPELLSSAYGRYFNGLWQGQRNDDETITYVDRSFDSGFASDDKVDWKTNLNAQCYCKLVPEAELCEDVPEPPPYFACSNPNALRWNHDTDTSAYRLGGNTFTTLCADINNDGHVDLINFEIVHWDVGDTSDPTQILLNDGLDEPKFIRPGNEATGLVRDPGRIDWNFGDMTGAVLDFDNDGRKDILICSSDYPGTRAYLFRQMEDSTFAEVPVEFGIDHIRAHGVAVADFDGDGGLDVALGHGRSRCDPNEGCYDTAEVHIFRNLVGQHGNWLKVKLEGGPGTNRAAIGARVEVTAGGITQVQDVGGGYGHLAIQHDLVLHFGLGDSCDVEKIVVFWPDEKRSKAEFTNIRGNYLINIKQGSPKVDYDVRLPPNCPAS